MNTSIKAPPENARPARPSHQNWDFALLILLCAIVFFFRLGSYPLFDLDEPRYAEAAREMLERNNWITPYFNYQVRFEKPVLFYWLIALAYQAFGLSEFSARFFSAATASATVCMVYAFGRHFISRQYGLYAGLILATSVLFIGIARMAITDMTLTCFMTGTALCLFTAAHKDLRWWLAAGVLAGFGILTKGPVALIIPGAIFSLYTLIIGQFKRCILNRWLPLALLIAVAIAGPWYWAIYQENGSIFLESQFMNNVTRYSDVVSGHKQPPYFYTLVLLVGFLPWTTTLPAALKSFWRQFKTQHQQLITQQAFCYLIPLYGLVWACLVFGFFSLGSTKLLTYILPLFPALALLTAQPWLEFSEENKVSATLDWRWMRLPSLILPLSTLIGGSVFITSMHQLLPREAAGIEANGYNIVAVVVLLVGGLGVSGLLQQKKARWAFGLQVGTMAMLTLIAMQGIVPNISQAAQSGMMNYLRKTNGQPLMLYEIQRTSLTFYGKRRIPRYVEEQAPAMLAELQQHPQTFIITKNEHLNTLRPLIPTSLELSVVEKDRVYSLLSVRKRQNATPQEPQP